MAPAPDPKVVAAALGELAETVRHIVNHGRNAFLTESPEAELLYLASCQVIIQLQAMIEDLPPATLALCSDLPLTEVRGMRNRLAHGYLEIDKSMLWETISRDVVPLIKDVISRIERTMNR